MRARAASTYFDQPLLLRTPVPVPTNVFATVDCLRSTLPLYTLRHVQDQVEQKQLSIAFRECASRGASSAQRKAAVTHIVHALVSSAVNRVLPKYSRTMAASFCVM